MTRLEILEPAQRKAVEMLINKKTTEEIAKELNVKPKTARSYINKAKIKFNVLSDHALLLMLEAK